MGCWPLRSYLKMVVMILLIAAIPFLIAMIVIYSLFGTIWSKSGSCGVFCCQLEERVKAGSQEPPEYINFEDYETLSYWEKRSSADFPHYEMEGLFEEESTNPSIAALLENLYQDDHRFKIFKCAAVLVSNSWALTTDRCVFGALSIRINSNYWAANGVVRKITKVVSETGAKSPKLVLLNFEKVDSIKPVQIAKVFDKNVSSFNWNGNRLDLPLKQRKKFSKLKKSPIELLQRDECPTFGIPEHISCYLVPKSGYCNSKIDSPLINSNGELVGIHLGSICEENKTFAVGSYLDLYSRREWLKKTVFNNN